jgi:hypothetical protein
MFHGKRLPTAVRIDKFGNHQTAIIDRIRFCDCEGVSLHGFDGAPDIDDLYATLHQFVCFLGQMVRHSRKCSFIRLVDVHSLHGTAECAVGWGRGRRLAADCMVEDEDLCCAGAVQC